MNDRIENEVNGQATGVSDLYLYRSAFEHSGVGAVVLDSTGRFFSANPAACRLFGYTQSELAGMTFRDITYADDLEVSVENMERLLRGEVDSYSIEKRYVHKDGHTIWAMAFVAVAHPARMEPASQQDADSTSSRQDEPFYSVAQFHDITRLKQTEAALAQERDFLDALMDTIPDHIYFKDLESRFVRNSRSHARFMGFDDPAEIVGKTDFDVFSLDHATAAYADEQRIIETGEPVVGKLERIRRADGRSIWVTATKVPLRDRPGRIIGTVGITRDVEEQVRVQDELEKQRRMLQAVLDTIPDYIVFKDRNLAHVLCNKMSLEFHGRTMEDMYGKTDADLLPPEDAERYAEEEMRAILTGEPVVATRFVRGNQYSFWEECIKMPLRDESGEAIGVLSVGRDVTQRLEMEQRLRLTQFAMDHTVVSTFWVSPEGRFIDVNEAACRSLGYSREELLSMYVWDIDSNEKYGSKGRPEWWETIKRAGSVNFETAHKTRDGYTLPVEMTCQYVSYGGQEYEFALALDIIARKRAEEALQEERNLLRTLIDALPDHIYVKGIEGRYLLVNRAQGEANDAITGFGYGVGHTDLEMLPADLAKTIRQNDLEVIQAGQTVYIEEPLVMPDGTLSWGWTIKVPLRDEQGQMTGLVGVTRDITELKQAEDALKAERNLLRTLIDALPDHIYVKDTEGRYVLVNRAQGEEHDALTDFGYGLGRTDFELAPERLAKTYVENDRAVLESGEPLYVEETLLSPNGKRRVGWTIKVPLRDDQGRVTGLVGVTRDITALKEFEEALKAERNLLRTLIDALPDHIYVKDTEGRLLLVNEAQAHSLGFASPREAIGRTDFDLYPASLAQRIWANDRIIFESGSPASMEEEFIDQMNAARSVWSVKAPLFNAAGEIIGMVGLSRDITNQKRLEDQLRQSQKMEAVGTLAGGVAHDFNNLLTSIVGYADFLIESLDPSSPQHEDALGIKRVAERAAGLTRQLLAFSRRQFLRPQILNLNAVVANTLKMLSRLVGEDVELVSKLYPDLGKVKVDPNQIEQVLMNLVVNAREAMPNGGRLVIETANARLTENDARQQAEVAPGAYVALIVSDTGIGMDAEMMSHIFDPFFTTKEAGTGLGLATVYGIVKQSGGHITVSSEPGKGTTFTVYLPLVEEAGDAAARGDTNVQSVRGSETVLIVEDDEIVRQMLKRALQRYGYNALEATNGEEAVHLCQTMGKSPDLLVTDVVMPGRLNGKQLASRLSALCPGLKVMYISGYMDVASVDEGSLEPGAVFLQKPFTPATLAKKVREALDG